MTWTNGPLTVYHGTDNRSAYNIYNYGINPTYFAAGADFGAGFYVTTSIDQAKNFANERTRTRGRPNAEVLEFKLDRFSLQKLDHLAFVLDSSDYHDLVDFCWTGGVNHGATRAKPYGVVYGPVSLWQQRLVIANCDQMCFPDPTLIAALKSPSTTISSLPNTYF